MSDSAEDLRDKATELVKKAAFKEGMNLTPTQESMAVKQVYESFRQMIDAGEAVTNLRHTTVALLLKAIKSLYP